MGIFDIFKRKKQPQEPTVRSIITEYYGGNKGYFLYNYAQNIYNIPEVRTAIETYADIFSTIPKRHERISKDGSVVSLKNNFTRCLNLKPNPLQNATQFWKEVATKLMLNSNVFIEPVFSTETGELQELYVLPTHNFKFNLTSDKRATVTFYDAPSAQKTYNLDELIYLNRFSALAGGTTNNLGLYETVIQALAKQALDVADPRKVRALLQSKPVSANLKKGDSKGVMDDLRLNFADNVNGIAYMDQEYTVIPINWTENDVNRELMKLVINTVYNYFGISDTIINGKASEIEYSMFIANKINPLARQVEQEFTSKLFTAREIEVGNKIELDTFMLEISTMQAKTQLFSVAMRQGIMNNDEARERIGLSPLPEGLGKKWRVTADTVDIEIADKYQLGKYKLDKGEPAPQQDDPQKTNKEVDDGKEGDI